MCKMFVSRSTIDIILGFCTVKMSQNVGFKVKLCTNLVTRTIIDIIWGSIRAK